MSEHPYVVPPESIEAYRVRVLFHCEELKHETNPTVRANIALYLAEAAATLARMEAAAALAAATAA
ncbi:MAG: hypothetical protein F6K09_05970 [Merismopedia sp. SIO2A8]|nr:hypothetical protein [Merismopedia sp. SIO2A8]